MYTRLSRPLHSLVLNFVEQSLSWMPWRHFTTIRTLLKGKLWEGCSLQIWVVLTNAGTVLCTIWGEQERLKEGVAVSQCDPGWVKLLDHNELGWFASLSKYVHRMTYFHLPSLWGVSTESILHSLRGGWGLWLLVFYRFWQMRHRERGHQFEVTSSTLQHCNRMTCGQPPTPNSHNLHPHPQCSTWLLSHEYRG